MRRRRSNVRRLLTASCIALLGIGRAAAAQTGSTTEGALDFVRAIGARSTGMGRITSAMPSGAESIWGNPALIARSIREGILTFRSGGTAGGPDSDLGVAVVLPFLPVGTLGFSARYAGYGTFPALDGQGTQIGTFTTPSIIVGATAATTFGRRFALGLTLKQLVIGFSCSGNCDPTQTSAPNPSSSPTTTALDVGAHAYLTGDSTLALGASMQNVGRKFQIIDVAQADPVPARAAFGLLYAPTIPSAPDIRVRTGLDVVIRVLGGEQPGIRVGGELSYQEQYYFRAGYIKNDDEQSGVTFGVGLRFSKHGSFDFAQMSNNLGGSSTPPRLLTVRYAF